MKNIVKTIRSETINYSDKLAIIDGKYKITYDELLIAVDRTSVELEKYSVKTFKRVALLCKDSIDYVILSLAVLKISAIIVPVPFASSKEEIDRVLKEMKIDFLIFEKGLYASNKAKHLKISSGRGVKFLILSRVSAFNSPRGFYSMNPAFIRFSSGTTGISKGVVISHEAIIQRTEAANKGLHVVSDDTILWVLSMSFHFVVTILLFLRRGATIILAGHDFPEGLLGALREHRPSFIYASPLHYHLLSSLGAIPREALAKVRIAVSTAVKLPLEIARMFRIKFGIELSEAYGIIEVGLPFINSSQAIRKRGSVGKILPDYRIKIINKDNKGAGEICLKGPGFFSAYFSPWKNANGILVDGRFNTGDIGRLDKDGFLFLISRAGSIINYCGMKIFPYEVELIINHHPAIKESLVFGIPHPRYGQLPNAKIVLKNVKTKIDINEVRQFCYQRLAPYKVPKEFHCVSILDKTPSGKLKR
ncbi:MAG: acyl--CoA ligase [Candidatus Omnitrophica bacterium]|nr:acyl--CoA ligase [Candidatus Omnitrophota bacterium]